MHLSLIPMTNKSHVRLIFAKDVCVLTLKRSVKSFLFLVIVLCLVMSFFGISVLIHRASKLSTTTTTASIKPILFPKQPTNPNPPNVHGNKEISIVRVLNTNETVSNVVHRTLSKSTNVNGGVIARKFKPVSLYCKNDFSKKEFQAPILPKKSCN